jgi:hypothetical protein
MSANETSILTATPARAAVAAVMVSSAIAADIPTVMGSEGVAMT